MSEGTVLERSWPTSFRAVNRLLAWAGRWGRVSLSPDDILARARRRTGIVERGALTGWDALTAMAADMDGQDLKPLSRLIAREVMVQNAMNGLRLQCFRRRSPPAAPLPPPLIIVGLHRTGTTFLHNLLLHGGGVQCPTYWEFASPVPCAPDATRIAHAKRSLLLARLVSPELATVHPVRWDLPEECWVAMQCVFATFGWTYHYPLPSYRRLLLANGMRDAFEAYRDILSYLATSRGCPLPWALKCPEHLGFMESLAEVFPGVRVVWTHRSPMNAVASFASLSAIQRRMLLGTFDARQVGVDVEAAFAESLQRGMRARASLDATGQLLDVHHEELANDPGAVVRRIHAFAGWAGGEAAASRAVGWAVNREPSPAHHYSRAQFGLTDEVHPVFREYMHSVGMSG